LLDSTVFDRHFVADVEDDGGATLRFGDDDYGRALTGATAVHAVYRIGNGRAGNVGADALAHIVVPATLPAGWPAVTAVRNPLPARGGTDAETIEQVRQYAPAAFRARQLRAVTESDYRDAAGGIAGVAGAVAAFRWTGSWYTAVVGIAPAAPDDVITDPGGRTRLAPEFGQGVRAGLTRYRLAGYDLELRTAQYVPLRIEIQLCAAPDHFRTDVVHAVADALSAAVDPFGRRGFFHPGNWTFGQSVYLSQVYAAVQNVEGVASLVVTAFHRFGRDPAGELEAGVVPMGPWEIARLDNDPNRMENGVLIVTAAGGK
jgi:predicted phage baseplate assembly protein